MKIIGVFLLIGGAAFAQNISVGIRGGVPFTDAFSATKSAIGGFENVPKRYTIGPTLEIRLPFRLGISFDILYKNLAYRQATAAGTSEQSAKQFEFPLMLRYRFGAESIRPFVAGGPTFNKISAGAVRDPVQFVHSSTAGIVLGAGIEVKALLIRLTPEIRFTHRTAESFRDAVNAQLRSNLNQAEFLVGLTF